MLFPLNSGITSTSQTYTSRTGAIAKIDAFKDVSVNPVLYTTGLEDETDYVSTDTPNIPISSAIFTEIRKGPHVQGLSTTIASSIENRLYPSTSVEINTYVTNKENTPSYKVKIYDASQTTSYTNKLATYGTSNSNIVFDIDNYDYFIILNPEIVAGETREDSVRPHFAKITRLTTFDTFGDGVEFTPTYTGDVAKNTNFEIYKGPHKVDDTDVVAVSYGLRGDTDANTDKYDKICVVNRPIFYFYNDRLEEKNQLDYNEKYTVTSIRWWNNLTTTITITQVVGNISQYEEGSVSKCFKVSGDDYAKLVEGMSIFDNNNNYLGNIELKYTQFDYRFYLDYYRPSGTLNATYTDIPVKIGKMWYLKLSLNMETLFKI